MKEKRSFSFFGVEKIVPYLHKYRKNFAIMLSFGLLGSLVDIILPLFRRYALDHFVGGGTFDTIVGFLLLYLFVIFGAAFVNYVSCTLATVTEVDVDRDLRNRAFWHMQTLSFTYFNQNSVGYIHARMINDTSRIGSLVSWSLMDAVWHISYLVGSVIVMFVLNARLALYVVLILPVLVLLFTVFQKRLVRVNREIREINSRITGHFNEGIAGAKTVKSLAVEQGMADRFEGETGRMKRKSIRASRLGGLFAATMSFASSVALAIVLWQGGYIASDEVGTFAAFMAYAQGMMEPIRWLVNTITSLITTQVNIERFTALLAVRSDVIDTPEVVEKYGDSFHPKKENWEAFGGDMRLDDVTFRYPDGDEEVLTHFTLDIPFGSTVAIVGETGAGKSTLVNLLCRFYEPTEGRLLIDGRDARERSQLWLHSSIGYVLQTPHLFSGTVRENLQMGRPDATDEQMWEALRTVSADGVVERLENGLDTDVGEGGDLLSTGEKQLISFARAVLCDPKLLILDEATASVDTVTEMKIQDAMQTVSQGRTVVMIAHRLSTVREADVILVVKGGKIIEQGKHKELLDAKGYYYDLYTRQYEDEATAKLLR